MTGHYIKIFLALNSIFNVILYTFLFLVGEDIGLNSDKMSLKTFLDVPINFVDGIKGVKFGKENIDSSIFAICFYDVCGLSISGQGESRHFSYLREKYTYYC